AVLPHFAGRMGDDFVPVLELDPKGRVGEQLRDDTGKLEQFFFGHAVPVPAWMGGPEHALGGAKIKRSRGYFRCSAEISVNSRRGVSKRLSILPLGLSPNKRGPSSCSPGRPMSIASMRAGSAALSAA